MDISVLQKQPLEQSTKEDEASSQKSTSQEQPWGLRKRGDWTQLTPPLYETLYAQSFLKITFLKSFFPYLYSLVYEVYEWKVFMLNNSR